jgi:hypothetical protein
MQCTLAENSHSVAGSRIAMRDGCETPNSDQYSHQHEKATWALLSDGL